MDYYLYIKIVSITRYLSYLLSFKVTNKHFILFIVIAGTTKSQRTLYLDFKESGNICFHGKTILRTVFEFAYVLNLD